MISISSRWTFNLLFVQPPAFNTMWQSLIQPWSLCDTSYSQKSPVVIIKLSHKITSIKVDVHWCQQQPPEHCNGNKVGPEITKRQNCPNYKREQPFISTCPKFSAFKFWVTPWKWTWPRLHLTQPQDMQISGLLKKTKILFETKTFDNS